MTSLNLSMLGSLKDLFLRGPQISDLNLSGCFNLKNKNAFLMCPSLKSIDITSSGLGESFEKEYLQSMLTSTGSGKKITVLKGGNATDWMTMNF